MLIILTNEHLISPQQVCHSCLLADADGYPRWHQGRLGCGKTLNSHPKNSHQEQLSNHYQCQMGFEIAQIEETLPESA